MSCCNKICKYYSLIAYVLSQAYSLNTAHKESKDSNYKNTLKPEYSQWVKQCYNLNKCSGHGTCQLAINSDSRLLQLPQYCLCDEDWYGVFCNISLSLFSNDPVVPDSDPDTPDPDTPDPDTPKPQPQPPPPECTVNGFKASVCGEHGFCFENQCYCTDGYLPPYCQLKGCGDNCFGHGSCKSGQCFCDPGWDGLYCDQATCGVDPRNCTQCHQSCQAPYGLCDGNCKCLCATGWEGQYCSRRINRRKRE